MSVNPGLFDRTCRVYHGDRQDDPTAFLEIRRAVRISHTAARYHASFYHASRTGRLQPWGFIILMIPGIGALAYILVELVPEMLSGPGAQQATSPRGQ